MRPTKDLSQTAGKQPREQQEEDDKGRKTEQTPEQEAK